MKKIAGYLLLKLVRSKNFPGRRFLVDMFVWLPFLCEKNKRDTWGHLFMEALTDPHTFRHRCEEEYAFRRNMQTGWLPEE